MFLVAFQCSSYYENDFINSSFRFFLQKTLSEFSRSYVKNV